MPLSEHEQRQLEQIEQALYADHPRFARTVRAADPRVHYKRRVVYAAVGFIVGVALLVAGLPFGQAYIFLSVAGFLVMLSCIMWLVSSYRRMNGIVTGKAAAPGKTGGKTGAKTGGTTGGKAKRARGKSSGGISGRLEERWRRRQEGDGR